MLESSRINTYAPILCSDAPSSPLSKVAYTSGLIGFTNDILGKKGTDRINQMQEECSHRQCFPGLKIVVVELPKFRMRFKKMQKKIEELTPADSWFFNGGMNLSEVIRTTGMPPEEIEDLRSKYNN